MTPKTIDTMNSNADAGQAPYSAACAGKRRADFLLLLIRITARPGRCVVVKSRRIGCRTVCRGASNPLLGWDRNKPPFSAQGASTMATRWLYTPDGKPAYYVKGEWLFSHPDGKPAFYIKENWVYTREGKPTFWIEDNWLYEHPAGRKSLYFG